MTDGTSCFGVRISLAAWEKSERLKDEEFDLVAFRRLL